MRKLMTLAAALGWAAGAGAHPAGVVPLVDARTGYLLGGSRGGQWLDASATAREMRGAKTIYRTGGLAFSGRATGSAPRSEGAPCEDTLFVKMTPLSKKAEWALGGSHRVTPRALLVQNPNQASYRALVAPILRAHGIARPQVQIAQLWRADLDGDGTQEVLLSATRKGIAPGQGADDIAPDARAGDYSLVLLRRLVGGKVRTEVLASEYHPRAAQFSAPNFFRLAGVVDADGDGKMEVLLRSRYYEGEATSLIELQRSGPREVLSAACGA